MIITPAFAQATSSGGGDLIGALLPFILIFMIMYFMIIRPQQRRMKEHREMVANLRRGDNVITNGGLIGKVTKIIDDHEIQLEISENVRVRLERSAIAHLKSKPEPVKG